MVSVCVRRSALLAIILTAASWAGPMLVRVDAPDYSTLYEHIPFKGSSIDIAGKVSGESYDLLLDRADIGLIQASGLNWQVLSDDIETWRAEAVEDGQYRSYSDHVALMRNWAANYPSICRVESIGPTHEGNWIFGVKIAGNVNSDDDRTMVLLESMHHSREWAAPEAARHFVDTLLSNYASNAGFRNYIDNHQIWVFPIVNVDGYLYDYPAQRSWRRNRQPFSTAIGCDPNRDYNGYCAGTPGSGWGALSNGSRSDHRPGSDTWMGAKGAWGKEINALAEFFKTKSFVADITLHSYSELVLWPMGDGTLAPDNEIFVSLGTRMAAQMARLGGGTYTPGQTTSLYPVAGGSCDWMYGWGHWVGGFPCLSYVFELGTSFYQSTSQLEPIQTTCFKGAWYLFQRADSIRSVLRGRVPPPVIAPVDSSPTGDFVLHWTPVRQSYNEPDRWELEELTGLTVTEDGIESGTGLWELSNASQSSTQKHSGSYSVYLGTGNNASNYMVTKYPYPVRRGDSLRYWIWYNTESNYDVTVAEVSTNGLEWVQLHDRFTGNSNGWVRQAFSLDPWAGTSVFIRFRYMTDDGTLGSGVYIDDVWPVPNFANRQTISNNINDTIYSFTGKDPGRYFYRVRGRNARWGWNVFGPLEDVQVGATAVAAPPVERPNTGLQVVGANPAAGAVNVRYSVAKSGPVRLVVHDAVGRAVRVLAAGVASAGEYAIDWDRRDDRGRLLPAGVYYCRLEADRTVAERITIAR